MPIGSRPAQQVRWRDVIILDENNNFFAVQNLSDESLSRGENRAKLKNAILAAATLSDTDIDGIPDRWEFQNFWGIDSGATTMTASGNTALVTYALSQSAVQYVANQNPVASLVELEGKRYLNFEFRRRLAGEGERLVYQPQLSTDGVKWSSDPGIWEELSAVHPWDGSGTEVVTVRTEIAVDASLVMARLQVEAPL